MPRVLSGIQPTGDAHLGNYLGAIRHWVEDQQHHDSYFCVVDLHALTVPRDPADLRARTLETAMLLLAAGLDPALCTLFVQSHLHEHAELAWVLQCVASVGELRRMTQFKDKAGKAGEESARVGLFTYPVLQAADILLYQADRVPVGDEQRQHLELCRDLAERFNHRYGGVFTVPEATVPEVGARIMDLQAPATKMSKSSDSPQGTILILDEADVIARKIKRAVTDTEAEVRFDPENKPGVSNLLTILAASTGRSVEEVAGGYTQYGPLKADTADAVVELLAPVRARYRELEAGKEAAAVLEAGADRARAVASVTVSQAKEAVGLLASG
ncbi:MAG TPA: tryptophan--tRNA ligase [Acidimicrobiales bacterium]|nr:tryptophan--tRNA ligase [Acidimicrobiales bacterium]